jgi:CTP synthase
LNVPTSQANNVTTGRIYWKGKKRREFLGKNVQVVPHITNEIKTECNCLVIQVILILL